MEGLASMDVLANDLLDDEQTQDWMLVNVLRQKAERLAFESRKNPQIKCVTTRYDVTSCSTDKPNVIVRRRWLRCEKVENRYVEGLLHTELCDANGRPIELIPGRLFRNPANGETFEIIDVARSQRVIASAA